MNKRKTLRAALIVVLICVFSFSAYNVVDTLSSYSESENTYVDLSNKYVKPNQIEKADDINNPPAEVAPIAIDFDSLLKQNKDVVGWLYCENTPINYPVVQSNDNDYYLRRMLNGKYNIAGTVFMDYRCGSDCSDLNTIIYGHNMKNDSMFGTFTDYKTQEYYDNHPVVWFLTPEQDYKIELIAGYVTSSTSEAYDEFASYEDLCRYIESTTAKSTFSSSVNYSSGEKIVTLSTCSYEYDTARYVLIGQLKQLQASETYE